MKFSLYLTTALLSGAAYLLSLYATGELKGLALAAPVVAPPSSDAALPLFLLFFAVATIFMVLMFRFYRGQFFYRLLFSLIVFLGLFKLFEIVFPLEFSALAAAIFLLGFFVVPTVWTHNLIMILASAGIGSVFALSFSEYAAVALLLFLSAYDVVAVFVTGHMITLAHQMIRSRATFALFIPERLGGFFDTISAVRPGAGFLILGGGDIVLPMIYLSAVARESMAGAGAGVCGALAGQFLNHLIVIQLRKPIPALPLIAFGAMAGVVAGRALI